MLRDGLMLTLSGVTIGLICKFGLARFVSGFVQRMKPADALTSGAVALILACTVLGAAWRASRLDPMTALRHE